MRFCTSIQQEISDSQGIEYTEEQGESTSAEKLTREEKEEEQVMRMLDDRRVGRWW